MPQNKHNNTMTKKGTTKVPHGLKKRPTTRKRQAPNVSSSDEVESVEIPSQKRQKTQKRKETREITIGSSDEDPEVSQTDGFRSNYGGAEQSVEVSATSNMVLHGNFPYSLMDHGSRTLMNNTMRELGNSWRRKVIQQKTWI
jgi:hypothetical protein